MIGVACRCASGGMGVGPATAGMSLWARAFRTFFDQRPIDVIRFNREARNRTRRLLLCNAHERGQSWTVSKFFFCL
jgi:hypothetical protein